MCLVLRVGHADGGMEFLCWVGGAGCRLNTLWFFPTELAAGENMRRACNRLMEQSGGRFYAVLEVLPEVIMYKTGENLHRPTERGISKGNREGGNSNIERISLE